MVVISVTDARAKLPDMINLARQEPVFLERRGKTAAVLVSPEQYDRMMEALEDAADVRAFDAAMAEEDAGIPWEQAKADLGWG
ncbi:type II toxin-antitoxin system Phd/YefM family antitoxin [Herbiconiux sp. KACC 21604]|uniref:type II toxin-antitoxin system Phd/YefM family antitoxin n=1 Tax=unclassified Herbiconiux TaxID=2618217 RepID=UPI00149258CC|nr:type II toxin-antitoxin system Phd/YefM family antitoxin [Herbiconiux sp. SALV-R1]QJU53098.1 type II toxin-antitoxin system Phd/YefM family antitoxin [Herbiconiux sp. SALV-R1]WPO88034.1 type II toxin-antitoxin system Phd/YefM family antitoxin [Herbiconiux sp. KACC 21604]